LISVGIFGPSRKSAFPDQSLPFAPFVAFAVDRFPIHPLKMRNKNTVKGTKALPQSASEIPSQQGYATAAEVDYRASDTASIAD